MRGTKVPRKYDIDDMRIETHRLNSAKKRGPWLAITLAFSLLLTPLLAAQEPNAYLIAFDALWADMDRNYSYFEHKQIDWVAIRDEYRPRFEAVESDAAFIEALQDTLSNLRDPHVRIVTPDGLKGTYGLPYTPNWNWDVIMADLTAVTQFRNFAYTARTKEGGFGYFAYIRQGRATPELVSHVIQSIRELKDAPGFILDLRTGASGGDELLARQIASEFCGEDVVYATSKYRDGPAHSDFTRHYSRILPATDDAYTKPIVCILGSRVVSSGEGLAKMLLALPNVTSIGAPTRGSSGNPRSFDLPGLDYAVSYSRWVDMMPDGTAIEGRGVIPEILDEHTQDTFRDDDPTWRLSLRTLREIITKPPQ